MQLAASRMMKIVRFVAALVPAFTPTGAIVRAQVEREFLRPAQAAKMLADSRPWAARTAQGRDAKIIFHPDGTGVFEGPMSMSTKWAIKGEDICITMTIMGEKCNRFARVAGGLDGYNNGVIEMQLRR